MPLRHRGTLNSRQAVSPLVSLKKAPALDVKNLRPTVRGVVTVWELNVHRIMDRFVYLDRLKKVKNRVPKNWEIISFFQQDNNPK
ncbi:hypothetical protein TNCV_2947561 [Trichonephila clavipes]|nr:hypothetical protein TNCV_2947561 [Trichonephila clavipes]